MNKSVIRQINIPCYQQILSSLCYLVTVFTRLSFDVIGLEFRFRQEKRLHMAAINS